MVGGSKNWCGTMQCRDDTFEGDKWLQSLLDNGLIKYGVGQIEQGSHTHFQFYIQLTKRETLNWLKRHVCPGTHWEPARGSPKQNHEYCTKEETRVRGPWEVGQSMTQGKRTDLDKAGDMIAEGASLREVADEYRALYIRYHRGFKALQDALADHGDRQFGPDGPEVWVFWGPSGTGKSRRAFETWPDAYVKLTTDKWWDGYRGQETVIFDDFKGGSMRLHDFQCVIDRYPMRVEVKGNSVTLSATRYVFTSNKHPREWYSADADPSGTVMRRINEFCANHGRLILCLGNWGQNAPNPQSGGVILDPPLEGQTETEDLKNPSAV